MALASLLSVSVVFHSTCSSARELFCTTSNATRNLIANNWKYYVRGYQDYNCLAYAMGYTDRWMWPWDGEPTVSQVKSFLRSYGYSIANSQSDFQKATGKKKIIVYSVNGSYVTHFAKKYGEKGIIAKWGKSEIFTGNKYASYTNNVYGQPCTYAYRYK